MSAITQQEQWNNFIKHDLPTSKNERWKYADLAFLPKNTWQLAKRESLVGLTELPRIKDCILLVFVNGFYEPGLSDIEQLPQGVTIATSELSTTTMETSQPFAAINQQLSGNPFVLTIEENCDVPVHLLYVATGTDNFVAHPRQKLILAKNSKAMIVEEYIARSDNAYLINGVNDIVLAAGAQLDHYKIQTESAKAVHIANIRVTQQQDSHAAFTNFSSGSLFARDDLRVELLGRGADCKASGYYRLQQHNQYIDHHVDIIHRAPHSNSEMTYKGTLDNKSRAVFNGRLCVEKDAQKIIAFQANHNLLLSSQAEVYSKPELEINADDVKCKHGATTGQLNEDALFYMQARGIARADALAMLVEGFAEEIMQRVKHTGIKQRARESIL